MDYQVLGLVKGQKLKTFAPVAEALVKGGKSTGHITWGLVDLNARFDIFILPNKVQNGSFNSITDKGGETGNDASQNYEAGGYTWLERPTIFWNPTCSVKIYSDVTGVTDDEGVVGYKRDVYPSKIGAKNLIHVDRTKKYGGVKVVIKADEIVLPPWVVLMHELGHMKQYFELVRKLNRPAHDETVESAWNAFATAPGRSSEPDNIERHEKPITQVHLRGYRKRYYHDAFHFGRGLYVEGWRSTQDRNYNWLVDAQSMYDNFIFTTPAERKGFGNWEGSLDVYDSKESQPSGYYRTG